MTRFVRASVAGLALALTTLALPASTLAAGSTVSSFSFKGQSADAFFQSTDGCIQTSVFVFAVDGQVKLTDSPKGVTSFASAFIDVFDFCTGTPRLSAFGQAELAAGDFAVSSTLSTASLTTSIELFDFVSSTSFVVDIDLDWVGAGSTFREKGKFTFTTEGFRITDRFDRTSRNATATGTVSDGCPNYTPEASQFARLADQKSGTKIVEKLAPISPPISSPESPPVQPAVISPPVSPPVSPPISPPVSPPISPPVSPPCPTASATLGSLLGSPTGLLIESVLAGILSIAFVAGLHAARAGRIGARAPEAVPARAT